MIKVLMVCTGNICRSPMAQAIATQASLAFGMAANYVFDSAGTFAAPGAARPDPRARAVLERRGCAVPKGRTRVVARRDFEQFDWILGMDESHVTELRRRSDPSNHSKIHLLLDFSSKLAGQEVPDPYYGHAEGFERTFDLCEAGVLGLLDDPFKLAMRRCVISGPGDP